MITERSIRADMAEEDFTQDEIEAAVEDYWNDKIDQHECNRDFDEVFVW